MAQFISQCSALNSPELLVNLEEGGKLQVRQSLYYDKSKCYLQEGEVFIFLRTLLQASDYKCIKWREIGESKSWATCFSHDLFGQSHPKIDCGLNAFFIAGYGYFIPSYLYPSLLFAGALTLLCWLAKQEASKSRCFCLTSHWLCPSISHASLEGKSKPFHGTKQDVKPAHNGKSISAHSLSLKTW